MFGFTFYRVLLSQSYELEMTANDDQEFWEVREWENLFHDLIEGIMREDGGGGTYLQAIGHQCNREIFPFSHLKTKFSNLLRSTEFSLCEPFVAYLCKRKNP